MTNFFCFAICLFLSIGSIAQSFKKVEKNADAYFQVKSYHAAIPLYQQLLEALPNDPQISFKLGLSYLETLDHQEALKYILAAYESDPAVDQDIYYYLGRVYQLNYLFQNALEYYSIYLTSGGNEELKRKINRKIEECRTGEYMYNNPVKANIKNIGSTINTEFDEYSPIVSPDESMMVFTSRRNTSTGGRQTSDGKYFEDVYQTFFVNGKWTIPKNIGKPVNTNNHDAAVSLSSDGRLMFLYYDQGGGDIFYSEYEGQEWSVPFPLNRKINTGSYETHASLSSDGKLLFFTSDRSGGYGGLDIYVSRLNEKDQWGEAQNLGPVINTSGDEDAPFIHPDGKTLYFSSNSHPGIGGFDIFRSDKIGDRWDQPDNLGYPINSTDDDIYFTISKDNQHGYYSSTKKDGYGGKDIYIISMPEPEEIKRSTAKISRIKLESTSLKPIVRVKSVEATNPVTVIQGRVVDAYTDEPLVAKLILKNEESGVVVSEQESEENGDYIFSVPSGINYLIDVVKEDYIFLSQGFEIPYSNDFQKIEQNVELFRVSIGSSIVLENIFFDTGKSSLREESEEELNKLRDILLELKSLKIKITGHTDSTGDRVFNKTLSEKRAKTVVNYLVEQGIGIDRLEFAGYGVEKPIASNNTAEGRQLNRRTEFEIIEN